MSSAIRLSLAASIAILAVSPSAAQPAPPAAENRDALPVSAAEARTVAEALARALEAKFVFPETGTRYAAMVRAKAARGGYDAVGTRASFATILTDDLQQVAADGHLRIHVVPPEHDRAPTQQDAPPPPPPSLDEAKLLAPGIVYIRFSAFFGQDEAIARARTLLEQHADAGTVIFDIRTHRGGGLAEMDALLPYLFARPTPLVHMDTREAVEAAGQAPLADGPWLRRIAGPAGVVRREHHVAPHATERRLQDARVVLLTAGRTASAAEHFALSMKITGRATLIGEPTAGAGHFGGMELLDGGHFAVFVPVGRTFDPATGQGWEGRGVEPDVAVPAADALVEALVRAGIARPDAIRLSASVAPTQSMERRRPRRLG